MEEILSGRSNDAEIADLLSALRDKGEAVEELAGFAQTMRRHAAPVFAAGRREKIATLVDTCGTGGLGSGTINVSTAAAFVVAGAGVPVAKHGNRSITSRCGSADVLETLGVKIELPAERAGEAIEAIGIGFLFAPAIHTATKHAMAARKLLGGHTVFNLLGPLTNPAEISAQIAGVFDPRFLELLATAMGMLGVRRAFVVHGAEGLGEISISGETFVAELRNGEVRRISVFPEDFGIARAPREAIAGGSAAENAEFIRRVFAGERGPRREVVLINAAAALVAAGRAENFREGTRLAEESIDSGAAAAKLAALVEFTQRYR